MQWTCRRRPDFRPTFQHLELERIFRANGSASAPGAGGRSPATTTRSTSSGEPVVVWSARGRRRPRSRRSAGTATCGRRRAGNLKRFTCPYHSWMYELDGSSRRRPTWRVPRASTGQRAGSRNTGSRAGTAFLFVNLDDAAEPWRAARSARARRRKLPGPTSSSRSYPTRRWAGNWKLAAENSMEYYTISGCTRTRSALQVRASMTMCCRRRDSLVLPRAPAGWPKASATGAATR